MTIREAQIQLKNELLEIYNSSEAQNITDWVMEHLTGLKRVDRLVKDQELLSPDQLELLKQNTAALKNRRPVQYLLGEAYFYGQKFYVQEGVLIPRPETEELVDWIIKDAPVSPIKVLDIGTGSGCIPISLQMNIINSIVKTVDISEDAIAIAKKNATNLGATIEFLHRDFLNWETYEWESIDVLVSNPPYIPNAEKTSMIAQVTEYEPSIALFVSDEEPLIFYSKLASFGKKYLNNGGSIYVEIHEDLGTATMKVFEMEGYQQIELKKDFQGKDRMIKVQK